MKLILERHPFANCKVWRVNDLGRSTHSVDCNAVTELFAFTLNFEVIQSSPSVQKDQLTGRRGNEITLKSLNK